MAASTPTHAFLRAENEFLTTARPPSPSGSPPHTVALNPLHRGNPPFVTSRHQTHSCNITLVLSVIAIAIVLSWLIGANLPRWGRTRTSVTDADREGVVLYWRPGCTYCMRLRTRLRFTRLQYVEVNIWRVSEAAAFVRSVADGNETVPTVTVAGRTMVNPSKRQLLEAVETYAPQRLSHPPKPTDGHT